MIISDHGRKSLFWKATEYILYAYFALFPFITFRSFLFGGTSSRSAILILMAGILGILFAIWLFKKGNSISIPKSPILLVSVIYFLSILISGIFGFSFENTFWSAVARTTGIWYLINLGIFTFFLTAVASDHKNRHKLILTIVLSTALYSLLAFLSNEGLGVLFTNYAAESFTFGNSTFAAMYIFGAFILSLYYLFQAQVKKWWMYILPVLLVINSDIISSKVWFGNFTDIAGEARATSYVIVLSIICLFFIWLISKIKDIKKRSKIVYSIFGLGVVALAWFAISLFSNDGIVRDFYLSRSTKARPLLWQVSESIIKDKPVLGWGADNFERLFEINYDNRFLEDAYGREPWFDRAHNIFIDQAVDNGILGLLIYVSAYLVIILCLIYSSLHSSEKRDRILSAFLIVYFSLHLLELQTAFETSISYQILIFMVASAAVLFHRNYAEIKLKNPEYPINKLIKYFIAIVFIVFSVWSLVWSWYPFVRAQVANGTIRTIGDGDKRLPHYEKLFGSPIDKHAFLWRTSTDIQRGIGNDPKVLENPAVVEKIKKEIALVEKEYVQYINAHPRHFRAHLNLADVLIYQRLLGVDKLNDAQMVLDRAIKLSPNSPQPYWMKAVAYVYMGQFDQAREFAKKALELNPKILESQQVVNYVEQSIKNFPDIDLYFFRQT